MTGQASVSRDVLSPTPPGPEGSNGNGLLRVQWGPGAWLMLFRDWIVGGCMWASRFSWRHPYGWRTNLRSILPRPICWWVDKGGDCEGKGAEHCWYNHDGENSACYCCSVVRPGQLWERAEG